MTSEPLPGEGPYPANVDRFRASRAKGDGLRLQVWADDKHDMTFTGPQARALASELERIIQRRNRNFERRPN